MAERKVRTITLELVEDLRFCAQCRMSLAHQTGMLYIAAPRVRRAFEFCSWRCMLVWLVRFAQSRVLDAKLKKTNILSRLGFSRAWGPRVAADELSAPVDDPDGRTPRRRRRRRDPER